LRALKEFRRATSQNRLPVLDSRTINVDEPPSEAKPVLESHTASHRIDAFPGNFIVRESCTHTAAPVGGGRTVGFLGWWQHDHLGQLAAMALIFEAAARHAQRRTTFQ
jgi:hypothetical protein